VSVGFFFFVQGFKAYEEKCYLNVNQYYSWAEAEENCKSNSNSNLAAILDRFEQAWLTNQFSTSSTTKWIGLNDQSQPGTYEWTSGDKFSFSNWDKNKPG
jgi:hypothetical protein